jgi:uncharacterized membrane protein
MEDQNNSDKSQSSNGEKEFWEKVKYLLNHKEISELLKLFRYQTKWTYLIETIITLIVAVFLIGSLIWLVDNDYIDKGSFGVMFGTVFGYMLSWRFGK